MSARWPRGFDWVIGKPAFVLVMVMGAEVVLAAAGVAITVVG